MVGQLTVGMSVLVKFFTVESGLTLSCLESPTEENVSITGSAAVAAKADEVVTVAANASDAVSKPWSKGGVIFLANIFKT